jgi:hypothetical protein
LLIIQHLLGCAGEPVPLRDLLAMGGEQQTLDLLAWLARSVKVLRVSGPAKWRGKFVLDLGEAVAEVTDEPGLRAALRIAQEAIAAQPKRARPQGKPLHLVPRAPAAGGAIVSKRGGAA